MVKQILACPSDLATLRLVHEGCVAGCFGVVFAFSAITLYEAVSVAVSCGYFGSVHVNPWITVFAIDLPAVIALAVFRPKGLKLFDWPPMPRSGGTAAVGIAILAVSTPILALNEPAVVASTYEVLEPKTWVGKKLPILEHIDIGVKLSKGNWLILLYHPDCPDCIKAIAKYEQMARDLAGNEDFVQIALIELPPYGRSPIAAETPCALGLLADTKDWFVTTPAAALISDGKVNSSGGTLNLPRLESASFITSVFPWVLAVQAG